MKQRKRVLMSLAMLLVSAIMLSSASYAWFSMNTEVEVEGIQFEAYSDSLFLEISENNQTFSPDNLTIDNGKKGLRPVAYGYIGDLSTDGKVYDIGNPNLINIDNEYYTGVGNYYRKQLKADTNDTKVSGEVYDYICVNEELYTGSPVDGYYIFGEGLVFEAVTVDSYNGDVYEKDENDYKLVSNPVSTRGLYAISGTPTPLSGATYNPAKVYYALVGNDYVMVDGLNAGSRLKGYYVLEPSEANNPTSGVRYLLNSDGDYVAFTAHATGTGLDGYWYRGYSENIDPTVKDSDAGNIVGVIGDMDATNSPYVLYDTVYLRMAAGSADATNLIISNVDVQGSDNENTLTKAVRVIFIATSSKGTEVARILYDNETGKFTNLGTNTENQTITSTLVGNTGEVITVDMYVYYDGTYSSVATHNLLNLSGHKISVGFEIDLPEYAK